MLQVKALLSCSVMLIKKPLYLEGTGKLFRNARISGMSKLLTVVDLKAI